MARSIMRTGLGLLGLATGLASPTLSAQALALPASDPVGIGRSGTGVAFGQSLEAASLNPALLTTLKDNASVFVSTGLELQSSQVTLISTQHLLFTTDRNRTLPSFGAAWRLGDSLVLGLKLDEPFLRHGFLPDESTSRFQQQGIKLVTHRLEMDGGWALNPNWSIGFGVGVTRVRYASYSALRAELPANPGLPVSASNPIQALMELPMNESGQAYAMTYSLGFRWALNPRWTIGGAYQSAIRATPTMKSGVTTEAPSYVDPYGFDSPSLGTEAKGPALLNSSISFPGQGRVVLPARASLGVRQRLNQFLTWEADLRYVGAKNFELPTQPILWTPTGVVPAPQIVRKGRDGFGISSTVELSFTKKWTGRAGIEFLSSMLEDSSVEPMVGGARTAGFSGGLSYKGLGGEWSVGYQYRQSQDHQSSRLDGVWDQAGYRVTGTPVQVEGMGHLMAIGFKKVF